MRQNKKKSNSKKNQEKLAVQLWLAVFLVIFGVVMLSFGFFVPPLGIIDNSVLVAFGEILTFSGSLIGIDYHYKVKMTTTRRKSKSKD